MELIIPACQNNNSIQVIGHLGGKEEVGGLLVGQGLWVGWVGKGKAIAMLILYWRYVLQAPRAQSSKPGKTSPSDISGFMM